MKNSKSLTFLIDKFKTYLFLLDCSIHKNSLKLLKNLKKKNYDICKM